MSAAAPQLAATKPEAAEVVAPKKAAKFSWDTRAVFAALFAALLIRIGVIKHIPW
jgi:hypothetical protein